jgi:histidinol-phosphatase (PHP family)
MFTYNYHTHTSRCGHAGGSDEEYVQAAIKAGYQILGFSDHAPYRDFYHEGCHMRWSQLDDYVQSISSLKEKYKDQIGIKIGLESEYYPFNHEERKELAKRFDYFLLGQHFEHPSGIGASYFRQNSEEEIMEYGKTVCEGLRAGFYTYLCHPDVILSHQPCFSKTCETVAHMIGETCALTDTPLEVNIRGILKGKHMFEEGEFYSYPNRLFWKIIAEYPVRVTIGIDAHAPEDLLKTGDIDKAMEELKDLDLHFISDPFI